VALEEVPEVYLPRPTPARREVAQHPLPQRCPQTLVAPLPFVRSLEALHLGLWTVDDAALRALTTRATSPEEEDSTPSGTGSTTGPVMASLALELEKAQFTGGALLDMLESRREASTGADGGTIIPIQHVTLHFWNEPELSQSEWDRLDALRAFFDLHAIPKNRASAGDQ
jgi:hypothetical protein